MNKDVREAYYLSNMFERKFKEEGDGKGQKAEWGAEIIILQACIDIQHINCYN